MITTYPDIPTNVLATLLDLCGKPDDNGISPRLLFGKSVQLTPHQLDELTACGILSSPAQDQESVTPEFIEVAKVLLRPKTNVTYRIWFAEHSLESNIQLPQNLVDGGGVVFNQVEDHYRIAAFVESSDVMSYVREGFLDHVQNALNIKYSVQLDPAMATSLFGFLDLLRRDIFAKLAGNTSAGRDVHSAEEIIDFIYSIWGANTLNQYLSAVAASGLFEIPSREQIRSALDSLTEAGFLLAKDGGVTPGSDLNRLIEMGLIVEGGMQWQRISLLRTGELAASNRIVLLTGKNLMLCFDQSLNGSIFFRTISYDALVDYFANELDTLLELIDWPDVDNTINRKPGINSEKKPELTVENMKCSSCGTVLQSGHKFCPQCGIVAVASKAELEPNKATEQKCSNCGEKLIPGMKFCTQCGSPVGHMASGPEPIKCSSCDFELSEGVKFCTSCGQPSPLEEKYRKDSNLRQKFCKKCNATLEPGLKFCTSCGQPLSEG